MKTIVFVASMCFSDAPMIPNTELFVALGVICFGRDDCPDVVHRTVDLENLAARHIPEVVVVWHDYGVAPHNLSKYVSQFVVTISVIGKSVESSR